jgi:hypothetical protein
VQPSRPRDQEIQLHCRHRVERFQFQDLAVDWSQDGTRQRLVFTGRSMSRHPALIMGPMWHQVLQVAKDAGGGVELDFLKLEHFNSSTISALVQFINEAHHDHVKLLIRYDGSQKWQVLSFEALQRAIAAFGEDHVRFENHA